MILDPYFYSFQNSRPSIPRCVLGYAVLCFSLFFLMADVSDAKNPDESGDASGSTVADEDTPLSDVWPSLSEPWTGDLDGMIERGEIRVLTTFTLGSYFIDRARPRGVVAEGAELLEEFAKARIGEKAKRLKVVVIPVRRDQLIPFLVQGYGDLASANLWITERRLEQVDFSVPFTGEAIEYLVTGPTAPEITNLDDLSGKQVFILGETSYFDTLTGLNERFHAEKRPLIEIRTVDPRLETEDILEMVHAGLLPMTVANDSRTELWKKVLDQINVREDIVLRDDGEIAIALRKNSPQLKEVVDNFAREHQAKTAIINTIVKRYQDNIKWVKPALERDPFRRLQEVSGLFKKYGEKYDFDWVLLASFGYQESGLRQNARSRKGAVGIMQVLPSTAGDRAVRIKNIHNMENNIHAGTKYLSVLRDRYFDDEALDPLQRMLFTMAGYNAGPNRINRLRKAAAERGLDSNRWFNNVENVVAAKVGREPVKYVGNIYKYYVAYKRALAELEARKQAREKEGSRAE